MTKNNAFLKSLQKVWKKSDDYVIKYIYGACKVKSDEDLLFLMELRKISKGL